MTLQNFIKSSRASKIKIVPKTLFSHIVEVVIYSYFSQYLLKKKILEQKSVFGASNVDPLHLN